MSWVFACRWLFEQTMGRVLPQHVAAMTYDQFFTIYLDGASIGFRPHALSESDAVQEGYIEPGQKTAYQLAQEAEANRVIGEQRAAKRSRRAAKRAARNQQEVAGV